VYLRKRALDLRKRALQDARVTKETCVKSFNQLCISAKEPYISVKELYVSANEPYISAKEPYISTNEPCTSAKEPYISAKEPYISTNEPCISANEPYISAKEPYETHESNKRPAPSHEQKTTAYQQCHTMSYNTITPCHTTQSHHVMKHSHTMSRNRRPQHINKVTPCHTSDMTRS